MATTSRGDASKALKQMVRNVQGKNLERALVAGALIIQNDAKRRAPVLTGNLRRSIHIGGHEDLAGDRSGVQQQTGQAVPGPESGQAGAAVYVGTDVEYAAAVEFGSEERRAKPYLRPAADSNRSTVAKEVADALRDLVRDAIP